MPTFHMVVCAWSRNIKVIPLVELELAVDPGAAKVVNKLIYFLGSLVKGTFCLYN